ncbi:purine/pyrimidine permease [Sebaldella sp. S0638]|uniref:purine/pyrimidine permease n=1 Tax=Sebaldella sp. S0638 TaxID=2957809 RepID=UPI00209CE968|nr:purine/pyrimidine permease [Sebaldella sp. S0638]MCP1224056.1 purine/pyrimidine permease [Sebaldella sp. S0638]
MKNFILGLQWMLFIIAASIAVPISISDLFALNQQETLTLMQNTLFILGVAGCIQGFFGHKMPISESPAGLWWSVLSIYSGVIAAGYATNVEVLQIFSGGMIFSGVLFVIFSATGLIEKSSVIFTPTVTFIYLILLTLQLSGTFVKGIAGINAQNQEIDILTAVLSIAVIMLTFILGSSKNRKIRQFSVLLSIGIGWIIFIIFHKNGTVIFEDKIMNIPRPLAFGIPKFDMGMASTAFFITFLLIMNMLASINIMGNITGDNEQKLMKKYKRSGFVSGINQILGGTFNTVGTVPISSSAGFVAQIGEKSMIPYLLGCIFVSFVSLFPKFINIMAALPAAIGYSVTFVLFSKMISMALFELKKIIDAEHSYTIIGISLLTGVGILFLPHSALNKLPSVVSAFAGNGLIAGSVLGVVLEQVYLFKKRRAVKKI